MEPLYSRRTARGRRFLALLPPFFSYCSPYRWMTTYPLPPPLREKDAAVQQAVQHQNHAHGSWGRSLAASGMARAERDTLGSSVLSSGLLPQTHLLRKQALPAGCSREPTGSWHGQLARHPCPAAETNRG